MVEYKRKLKISSSQLEQRHLIGFGQVFQTPVLPQKIAYGAGHLAPVFQVLHGNEGLAAGVHDALGGGFAEATQGSEGHAQAPVAFGNEALHVPFLTDSRIKSVGRAKGILTTQGFLFFCPGILTVMVSYGIIEKGGIICS